MNLPPPNSLEAIHRLRAWTAFFIFGLLVSGLTASIRRFVCSLFVCSLVCRETFY